MHRKKHESNTLRRVGLVDRPLGTAGDKRIQLLQKRRQILIPPKAASIAYHCKQNVLHTAVFPSLRDIIYICIINCFQLDLHLTDSWPRHKRSG